LIDTVSPPEISQLEAIKHAQRLVAEVTVFALLLCGLTGNHRWVDSLTLIGYRCCAHMRSAAS
jgi:hypothetical protein